MVYNAELERMLESHPCYNEKAHHDFARMHIPVAPKCNIQCNFCNRKFDCCNESRPGVTSELLTPEDAVEKIRFVKEKIPQLTVIGIAGPGDPLANDETFRTLKLIGDEFPDLTLCISTNGLMLPDNAQRLYDLGVRFVTVTMCAPDPETGSKIYDSVIYDGKVHRGEDGAMILLYRQIEGIRICAQLGMMVKVNIVMIPGINDDVIPTLVKKVKALGAYIVNILPLIPVEGTKFSDLRAPTPEERREMMDRCELDARMMRHCRQCRADAIGMLGDDRSQEFVHFSSCGSGCGPNRPLNIHNEGNMVAVAISPKGDIGGFGNSTRFRIYDISNGSCELIKEIPRDLSLTVAGDDHASHLDKTVAVVDGCNKVIVSEIGELPMKMLKDRGIIVLKRKGDAETAVKESNQE